MSEEEIITLQTIQYAIDNVGSFDFGDFDYDTIRGILDLYNKSKEKNKQWKDKIKAKIEELDKLIIETQKELGSASKEYTIYVYQKSILQELLEDKE